LNILYKTPVNINVHEYYDSSMAVEINRVIH